MKKLLMSVSSKFSYQPSKIRVPQLRFYCDRPPSSLSNHPGPLAYYKSLVNQGKLKHDSYQEKVAFQLENLLGRLDQYEKDMEEYHINLSDIPYMFGARVVVDKLRMKSASHQ